MTIQQCYAALEGDCDEVLSRLYSEALVKKFLGKFLNDPSFQLLEDSMKAGNHEEAFRAAHTLKGVSQNLSLGKLYHSSHDMTEALRTKDYALAEQLMPVVEEAYAQTIAAIRMFQEG